MSEINRSIRWRSWIGATGTGVLVGTAVYLFFVQDFVVSLSCAIVYAAAAKLIFHNPGLIYGTPSSRPSAKISGLIVGFLVFIPLGVMSALRFEPIQVRTAIALFAFGGMVVAFALGIEYGRARI